MCLVALLTYCAKFSYHSSSFNVVQPAAVYTVNNHDILSPVEKSSLQSLEHVIIYQTT